MNGGKKVYVSITIFMCQFGSRCSMPFSTHHSLRTRKSAPKMGAAEYQGEKNEKRITELEAWAGQMQREIWRTQVDVAKWQKTFGGSSRVQTK